MLSTFLTSIETYIILKGECAVKVIVHHPKTEQGKQKLKRAVADTHVDAVVKYISKLNCTKGQKEKLLKEVINNGR